MMDAELDGIISSGGRQGKQFTYALFEERVARFPAIGEEAAIAELTKRYFLSRGPATLHDFAWWSGLRTDALPLLYHKQTGNGIFKPTIIINGKIAGTWRRVDRKGKTLVEFQPFGELNEGSRQLLTVAEGIYGKFLGKGN